MPSVLRTLEVVVIVVVLSMVAFVRDFAAASAGELGPDSDWCAAIDGLAPGEELVLAPGDYSGGCTIRHGGREGLPIVIRGADPDRPSRLVHFASSANVVDVRASHVVLRNLVFGPTMPSVDAVRVYETRDVAIEDCLFSDIGGLAIVANHSVRALSVRRNRILRSLSTAMYFGCHDGLACQATDIVLEQNYVQGVDAGPAEIGYGIQIKLNSEAVIRDNVVVDTKGPGIMVYGTLDQSRRSVVERNFVAGSRTSSGIVIGGGPAVVRNNVAVRNAVAGVGVENYGRRSLLRGISIVHNTIWGNHQAGVAVADAGGLDVTLIGNAVQARSPGRALPRARAGVTTVANSDCSRLQCFRDPWGDDFSPAVLPTVGAEWARHLIVDDYFGTARPLLATVGAVEPPGRPILPGMKELPR